MSFLTRFRWMITCTFISWCIFFLIFLGGAICVLLIKPDPVGCVISPTEYCSKIGGQMIQEGGSSADAVIATLLCESVHFPAIFGIGGSFLMIMANLNEGVTVLNAVGRSSQNIKLASRSGTPQRGPDSILIPGALLGFAELHKRYGKLLWADLFQPAITLCREGIKMTKFQRSILKQHEKIVRTSETLRKSFVDSKTNNILKKGRKYKMEALAKSLELIAEEGPSTFYSINGTLNKLFSTGAGAHMSNDQMDTYTVKWEDAIEIKLKTGHKLVVPNVPGAGPLLVYLFSLFNSILTTNGYSARNWSKVVECFKFMFAMRRHLEDSKLGKQGGRYIISDMSLKKTLLRIMEEGTHDQYHYYGDERGQPPSNFVGTQVVILSRGSGLSVTATLNSVFGSGIGSSETGILLNNEADGFDYKTKDEKDPPINSYEAFKRPLHLICPTIVLNPDNTVRLVLGAANGPRMLTAVALVVLKHLFFEMEMKTAVDEYRLHHQLIPMNLFLDKAYENDQAMVAYFRDMNHNISFYQPSQFDAVLAISNTIDTGILGIADRRLESDSVYYIR